MSQTSQSLTPFGCGETSSLHHGHADDKSGLLFDTIVSTWTKISESFDNLLNALIIYTVKI